MVTTDRESRPEASGWYVTEEGGMTVHWLPVPYSNQLTFRRRIWAFLRFALGARKRVRSLEADVVFATSTPLTIVIPGVHASKRNGIPMVFEVRDLWPEVPIAVGALTNSLSKFAARVLERYAYRHSDQIIALSPGMKEGVVKTGYQPDCVTIIPNGCDIELFQGREGGGRRLRASHDWLGHRPLVLYAGTIGIINGVEYLVKLAAETWNLDPEIRFLVVGGGHQKEAVRTLAESMGVLNRNFFMTGAIPKQELPDWLAAADIAMSVVVDIPELWPNSANKFFDALAAGRPIAINYSGWQRELLEAEDCGFALPPQDVATAACTLTHRIRDKEWIRKAGSSSLQLAKSQFNRDDLYKRFETVLTRSVRINSSHA
jgi:glycosyltransferase involved in cell wall biosynthesis